MPNRSSRRRVCAPRLGAVAAIVALALTTAFMQPMHAASEPMAPAASNPMRAAKERAGTAYRIDADMQVMLDETHRRPTAADAMAAILEAAGQGCLARCAGVWPEPR
jgi:hypothetical protein